MRTEYKFTSALRAIPVLSSVHHRREMDESTAGNEQQLLWADDFLVFIFIIYLLNFFTWSKVPRPRYPWKSDSGFTEMD